MRERVREDSERREKREKETVCVCGWMCVWVGESDSERGGGRLDKFRPLALSFFTKNVESKFVFKN